MSKEQILAFLKNALQESVVHVGDGEYSPMKVKIDGDSLAGQLRTMIVVLEAEK